MNACMRFPNPATALTDLFEDLFNTSIITRSNREISGTRWPEVDIIEDEHRFHVRADMPGLEKNDIAITVENGVLSISGEKKEEKRENKEGRYSYFERSYGKFSRSFNLPDHVDTEHIEATYKNGVLELALNKTEKAKPRSIEVTVK
jgi:HSP20 family protein